MSLDVTSALIVWCILVASAVEQALGTSEFTDNVKAAADGTVENVGHGSRVRRNAYSPPASTEFNVQSSRNVSELKVGDLITVTVDIIIPNDTELVIEIFVPTNDTMMLAIGSAEIASIGSCLTTDDISAINANATKTYRDGIPYMDSILYEIQEIAVNQACNPTTASDLMVQLTYDLLVTSPGNDTLDGTESRVGCGVEYSNSTKIWIMSNAYTIKLNETTLMNTERDPEFNVTGPDVAAIGNSHAFALSMYIPHSQTELKVEVLTIANQSAEFNDDVISLCHARVTRLGTNFKHYDIKFTNTTLFQSESEDYVDRLMLDLGTIVNTGDESDKTSATTVSDDLIEVEFVLNIADNSSLVGQVVNFGVAVQMGDNQIWVAEVPLTVNDTEHLQESSEIPSFDTSLSSDSVAPGDTLALTVEMTPKANTAFRYVAEAMSSPNVTDVAEARLRLCNIQYEIVGSNMKCCEKIRQATIRSTLNSTQFNDYGVLDIGALYNIGIQTTSDSSLIRFKAYYELIEEATINIDNTEETVFGFGVNIGYSTLWVSQHDAKIINETATPPPTNLTNDKLPIVTMSNAETELYVGDTFTLDVDMYFYPGLKFTDVEVAFGETTTDTYKVCKVTPIYVGRNMPCLSTEEMTKQITFYNTSDRFNGSNYVSIIVDSISNIGKDDGEVVYRTDDNKIQYQVLYQTLENSSDLSGSHPFVGMRSLEDTIWVGMHDINISESRPSRDKALVEPKVYVGGPYKTLAGQPITVNITIKPPAEKSIKYELYINTGTPEVTVCTVEFVRHGENFPCGVELMSTELTSNRQEITATLSYATSLADTSTMADDTFDESSIELQAILYPVGGLVNTTYNIAYSVKYEGHSTDSQVVLETGIASTEIVNGLDVSLNRTDISNSTTPEKIGNTEIFPGETIRVEAVLTLNTSSYTPRDLKTHLVGPDGETTQPIDILSIDDPDLNPEDFGCQSDNWQYVKENFTASDGSVVERSVALGYLYPYSSNYLENIVITVRGYARLKLKSSIESTYVSAVVTIGDQEIYAMLLSLTVQTDPAAYSGYGALAEGTYLTSESDTTAVVSEDFLYNFCIEIPEYSTVHIQLNVSQDDKVFQFFSVGISSAGQNVGDTLIDDDHEFEANRTEYIDYTQQTRSVLFNIGAITNRVPYPNLDAKENQVCFNLKARAFDTPSSTNGSLHDFNLAAYLNNGAVTNQLTPTVELVRHATSTDINITASVDCDQLTTNDEVFVSYVMAHTNSSSAIAKDVELRTFLPPFLKYNAVTTFTSYGETNPNTPVVNQSSPHLLLQIPELSIYGSYEITVKFVIVAAGNQSLSLNYLRIPWKLSYISVGSNLERQHSSLDHVSCNKSYTVPSKLDNACNETLGIATGLITGHQIRAAPLAPSADVSHIRKNGGVFMEFGTRKSFEKYAPNRYIQIDLLALNFVSSVEVITSGDVDYNGEILSSKDGIAWQQVVKVGLKKSGAQVKIHKLARYIRAKFVSPANLSVNLEVYGCLRDSGPQAPVTPLPTGFKLAPRQFLVSNSSLFVCDSKPDDDFTSICHVMDINRETWREMDPRLQNLLGVELATNFVFAISKNGNHMVSSNGGHKWMSVSPHFYTSKNNLDLPQDVPWKMIGAEVYTSKEFKADDDGIKKTSGKYVLRWENV